MVSIIQPIVVKVTVMDKNFKHSNLILVFGVVIFVVLVYGVYYFNEYQKGVIKRSANDTIAKATQSNFSTMMDSLINPKTTDKTNLEK